MTGGNRGIGLAVVKGLAKQKEGCVLLGSRNLSAGKREAEKMDGNVKAVLMDLSSKKGLASHISDLKKHYSHIDVLVNNAAVLCEGNFIESKESHLEASLRVNTLSAYQLMKAFVPSMIKRKYGRIVNISSGWGSFNEGLSGPLSYSLSKAALNALTFSSSQSLPKTIKVNSMCPGWVRTRMGGMNATRSTEKGAETALWLANLPSTGPTGGFYRDKKSIQW